MWGGGVWRKTPPLLPIVSALRPKIHDIEGDEGISKVAFCK